MREIKVLVVEDEKPIREMLVLVLERAGFTVAYAADTFQAWAFLTRNIPDLILLDWMLPGQSGVDWAIGLKAMQPYNEIPIILLTARGEEEDKVFGFEVGVEDYITKPFSPRELVARIKAVLRRTNKLGGDGRIEAGGIALDTDRHCVSVEAAEVVVSPTEFRLLQFFMTHVDKVHSRARLLEQVWGVSHGIDERTVDVHIRRLRKILGELGREQSIQTVRGFGYRFSQKAP